MTGRVQTLRSNVSGSRPTGRQPGEIYVNWADGQIGVINSSNGAQDFVAVRFFSTTANYNTGDFVIQGGQLYRAIAVSPAGAFVPANWAQIGGSVGIGVAPSNPQPGTLWWDSVSGQLFVWYNDGNTSQWVIANNATALLNTGFLPLAGGTLTGPLTLAGNPATALQATPKQYVDALPVAMNDNRIINGDMRIDQRNNGASGTAISYMVDRWVYGASIVGKGTWSRYAHGPGGIATTGCGYNLGFTSASAYAPLAADAFYFHQPVEADMAGDFAWGGAGAQPVTLSFWVTSSLTGTFSGAIRNYPLPSTRSYPFSFNIPVANTYTKIAITIPGDTAGTWVLQGNAAALAVIFDLGSGATWRGPANAWAAGNFVGANGAQSVVATNGATYNITGVKLEVGSIATPFDRQSPAKTLNDCRRYYQQLGNGASNTVGIQGYAGAVGPLFSCTIGYQAMRAAPTAVAVGTFSSANTGPINLYGGLQTMLLQVGPPAVGGFSYYNTGAASYIALTAEL